MCCWLNKHRCFVLLNDLAWRYSRSRCQWAYAVLRTLTSVCLVSGVWWPRRLTHTRPSEIDHIDRRSTLGRVIKIEMFYARVTRYEIFFSPPR